MLFDPIYPLILPGSLPTLVQRRRALVIISRVRLVAALFALLTPLWIPIDIYVFPSRLGAAFTMLRIAAAIAFAVLFLATRGNRSMRSARWALTGLLITPSVFFVVSQPLLANFDITGQLQQTIAAGYAFLPFVMVAGLSMFPITAFEGACLSVPLLVANLAIATIGYHVMPFESHLGAMWLLALLCVVATLAGMSQLHFMTQLVSQASHDGLTRAYTRRVGEELLELQFDLAHRNRMPLVLLFIDLDDFKSINDRFGHEDGDDALRQASAALRRILRRVDLLVRWGGEEFVVALANTDTTGARMALHRLRDGGLGKRPDGTRLTASIGVSERISDCASTWLEMVEKADHRMYEAKQKGKDRVVLPDGEEMGG